MFVVIETKNININFLFCSVTESLCRRQTCPIDLITPPDDCHVNYTLSFSIQVRVSFTRNYLVMLMHIYIFCCILWRMFHCVVFPLVKSVRIGKLNEMEK